MQPEPAGVAGVAGVGAGLARPGPRRPMLLAEDLGHLSLPRLTVEGLNELFLQCHSEDLDIPPQVRDIHRGGDPTHDLTWLLVGFDPDQGTWNASDNFDFQVRPWLKEEALQVSQALGKLSEPGTAMLAFIELCDLLSQDKVPYGIILGYLAQTGMRMRQYWWEAHDLSPPVAYFLPHPEAGGEDSVTAVLQQGATIHTWERGMGTDRMGVKACRGSGCKGSSGACSCMAERRATLKLPQFRLLRHAGLEGAVR